MLQMDPNFAPPSENPLLTSINGRGPLSPQSTSSNLLQIASLKLTCYGIGVEATAIIFYFFVYCDEEISQRNWFRLGCIHA